MINFQNKEKHVKFNSLLNSSEKLILVNFIWGTI